MLAPQAITKDSFFYAQLRLHPKALSESGQHDDNVVTNVNRPVDHADVVTGLTRLN